MKKIVVCILCLLFCFGTLSFAEEGPTWTCPVCGTENHADFCGECGAAKPSQTAWLCPACGKENDTRFCIYCGTARPEEENEAPEETNSVTEYVLILSNSPTQHESDPGNLRAEAANKFVDMLPDDNARLSVFVVANKDKGSGINWGKGKFDPVSCYSLRLNKDKIHDPYSHDRMFCIYQIEESVSDLTAEKREEIKQKIDCFYTEMPISDAFNDLPCAVYAAMDYLAGNLIKNACMLMISDETVSSYHGFKRGEGEPEGDMYWAISNKNEYGAGNPEGDTSFLRWIRDRNARMSDSDEKFSWSFNWIDLSLPEKRPADRSGYDFFCDLAERLNGVWHTVEKPEDFKKLSDWIDL